MFPKRWSTLFLLLSLLLSLCLFWITGCSSARGSLSATPAPTRVVPLTAKQAYPFAKDRVNEWQPTDLVEMVWMQVEDAEIERGPRAITFRFIVNHPLGPFNWQDIADVTVDTSDASTQFETYLGPFDRPDREGFNFSAVMIDSDEAVRLAEENGGRNFRAKYPGARVHMDVLGYKDQAHWFSLYRVPDLARENPALYDRITVGFSIDARTGQVR